MDKKEKNKARFWMLFPVILLVTSVTGWMFMVRLAVNDPGFSVEKDYYKKAAHYDEEIAQRAENGRLGWDLHVRKFVVEGDATLLTIEAVDSNGAALLGLRLSATAFPTARGDELQELVFVDLGSGSYQARWGATRRGLWEVRLRAESGLDAFTQIVRPELSLDPSAQGALPS